MSSSITEISFKLVIVAASGCWRGIMMCCFAWQCNLELFFHKWYSLKSEDQHDENHKEKLSWTYHKPSGSSELKCEDHALIMDFHEDNNRRIS